MTMAEQYAQSLKKQPTQAEQYAQSIKEPVAEGERPLQEGEAVPEGFETFHDPMQGTMIRPVEKERTVGEKLTGGAEALSASITGATTGAAGFIKGFLKSLKDEVSSGEFNLNPLEYDRDRQEAAANRIIKKAQESAAEWTDLPESEAGQEYTQNIAEIGEMLGAFTPLSAEMGAVSRTVRPKVRQVAGQILPERKTPTPEAPKQATAEEISTLAKQAAEGNKKAKQRLAQEVKTNPEAVDAADRLGIELPADVLGDSELVKQTAGLVRSQVGDESARWAETITAATTKADDLMDDLGRADIATTSGKILDKLNRSRGELETSAENIYKNVSNNIPKSTKVSLVNSKNTIDDIITELGDIERLRPEERKLYNLVNSDNVTYEALNRERRLIGKAIGKLPEGPYANAADSDLLKRVYSALKKDQLDNVGSVLGDEARDKLHLADRTFQKKVALDERIAKTFGKEGEGSIATLLNRALVQGSKGDISALNKVLKTVPDDLKKEALVSAIGNVVQSKRATDAGTFDFGSYTKMYQGLRKNAPIYKEVVNAIGKDAAKVLNDLYIVSKRVSDAKSKIITTGKANQEILKNLQSEALIQKVVKATIETGVKKATLGGISPNMEALLKSPKDSMKAIGELFRSKEFQDLAVESINQKPSQKTVNWLVNSKPFQKWKKTTGNVIISPEAWVYESLVQQPQEQEK